MKPRADFPKQIETERLRIAIYKGGDGKAFYRILQQNAAYLQEEMYEVKTLNSVLDAEIYVEEMIESWGKSKRFVPQIIDISTGEMIGQLWIEPRWEKDLFEIGYFIVEKKQGQGLITEAVEKAIEILFEQMHAMSLEISTKVSNERSIKLAKRCGFTFSHRVKDGGENKAGKPVDMLHFRLMRSDFATNR